MQKIEQILNGGKSLLTVAQGMIGMNMPLTATQSPTVHSEPKYQEPTTETTIQKVWTNDPAKRAKFEECLAALDEEFRHVTDGLDACERLTAEDFRTYIGNTQ